MIGLVLVSFILIGAVTLIFFQNENSKYHTERLLRKEKSVLTAINYFLHKHKEGEVYPFYTKQFAEKIIEVSEINNFEINVFDTQGELITSTHMEYFEEGILPKKILQSTLDKLSVSDSSVLISELKEEQNYQSTFSYIKNEEGEVIAIVNLPYFSNEALNKEEIEVFFTSLVQIYIVLLAFALLIAYFLSSNITKGLRVIAEKMRLADFSSEYEDIVWKEKGEIGDLIEQYNKMMQQLRLSAEKIAKTERESAWREMAKQVAHEIKNPLTPMKLSVQQLERAWKDKRDDFDDRMIRFTKSMVEQIDALSSIAGEFSNFAQMPKAINEVLDLKLTLEENVELFKTEETDIKILFDSKKEYLVFADKNQLARVLNNLLKNAIQSIPDERKGRITLELKELEEQIQLTIGDNGSGIDPDQVSQIFLPNFTTKTHGMGLGLAMVKTIIEFSGGTITFDTKVGEGTTFKILLPKIEKNN